ncbi:MAG: short-chain fatty acid transporter [Flavobacteriales bacterium]|nr:short-chain fatty acid transporter [Flavobacteriales bacterium]
MSFASSFEKAFRTLLPAPFTIAVVLTLVTMVLAFLMTDSEVSGIDRGIEILSFWENGIWNSGLMVFAMQMMLILVLGHTLALTKPVDRLISFATRYCNTTASAAAIVTLLTVNVALFNWGLGLIFGAILARKVGEHAVKKNLQLNYPLIGAAGYSGLMVWHGGISGSAPIKVAEEGHIQALMKDNISTEQLSLLPDPVSFSETVFGNMNLVATALVVILLPAFMFLLGKRADIKTTLPNISDTNNEEQGEVIGAEKLDNSTVFALIFGLLILGYAMYSVANSFSTKGLGFITPNFINFVLLGLGITLHGSFRKFIAAVEAAIGGASGILIQFPLYFGIMGIMNGSGLVNTFSDFFVSISNESTFPIFTLISAGIVNIFVPSGGGQWGVQGPIILQAATQLGVDIPKSIMALAYGDQLTNMLQPFWALPLLGITGLKAKEILPYTVALMAVGTAIFVSVLLVF